MTIAMSRTWKAKFANAFRGMREGAREGTSFRAHALAAIVVLIAAAAMRMNAAEWCIVLLCITIVVVAEYFNTALEALAKAITREADPHIRDALDIASGAVLAAAFGSVAVGATLFGHRLGQLLAWW
jgi:diacylglycerol kinase